MNKKQKNRILVDLDIARSGIAKIFSCIPPKRFFKLKKHKAMTGRIRKNADKLYDDISSFRNEIEEKL